MRSPTPIQEDPMVVTGSDLLRVFIAGLLVGFIASIPVHHLFK